MKLRISPLTRLLVGVVCCAWATAHADAPAASASTDAPAASALTAAPASTSQHVAPSESSLDDASGAQVLDRIVAVVNNGVILQSELERNIHMAQGQMRERGITPPPAEALQSQVLEQLITTRIQTQRADEAGIKVNDAELNQAIEHIAAQNKMSVPQFAAELRKDGIDFPAVREQIRDQIMIQQLREKDVDQRIVVTDQDVNLYLANHSDEDDKTEYKLAHILVSVPDNADEKARAKAKAKADGLLKQIKDGADFAQVAIAHSDSPTALQGGDLGWRKGSDLPTLFANIVPTMKTGEISNVIAASNGFNIIKLVDKRTSGKRQTVVETHAEHILLTTNALRDEAECKALAQKLYGELKNGADFEKLATQYSDDPGSKNSGGDLGWQPPGAFVPAFQNELDSLQPGQISKPFQTQFGWHIAKVLGRRTRDVTDQMQRARARQAIVQRREEQDYQNFVRRLRDEAYVEIRLKPGMITNASVAQAGAASP